MKLGNVSQSIVPVPKFFTDKEIRTIDIFKLNDHSLKKINNKRRQNYFRTNDLFELNHDININHNPRTFTNDKDINYDGKKYIPIYDRTFFNSNAEKKKTYFPHILNTFKVKPLDLPNNKNEYGNVFKYLKNTNLNNFLKKDLRQEIMDNTKNLIDRINITYDLNNWNNFNTRMTMNKEFQPAYSPLTDAIQSTGNYKDEFIKTLYRKSLGLKTITEKSKMILKNNIKRKGKKDRIIIHKKNYNNSSMTKNNSDLDRLLDNNRSNLLSLKTNNKEPCEYSKEDQEFIDKNESVTSSINKCNLYHFFPSMTRMEFEVNKVFPKKKKNTIIDDWGVIDIDKYKSKKEIFSCMDNIWKRPLHFDAYKIVK